MIPHIVARPVASLCVLLWMAGSLSVVYGSLGPHGSTSHCPQEQAHPQNGQGHCFSHCHAIDSQASDVRSRCSLAILERFASADHRPFSIVRHPDKAVVPRGPPRSFNEQA